MHTDPTSGPVQQPQIPPRVQSQVDVHIQPSTFSKDMSNEQLALWLRNHSSLTGTDYEKDISKLRGTYHIMYYFYAYHNYIIIVITMFRCQN